MNKPVRLQVQAPNFAETREFIQLITGEEDPPVTFQVFDDKAKRFEIAEWRHGKLCDPDDTEVAHTQSTPKDAASSSR